MFLCCGFCFREKEMEAENNLRTLECLRGRLLAERLASKSAKDDAEFMEHKLTELEKQLSIDTELRNKAEKKLKLLVRKMKSMNIASPVKSSYTTSSGLREPDKQNSDSQISKPVKCSTSQDEISDSSTTNVRKENSVCSLSDHDHHMTTTVSSSGSVCTAHSRKNSGDHSFKEELRKIKDDEPREIQQEKQSEIQEEEPSKNQEEEPCEIQDERHRESMAEHMRQTSTDEKEGSRNNSDSDEFIDNSLALVPATFCSTSTTNEPKINSRKVLDILSALRHAKKQLQNSMGRKDGICSR
ncbi:hypothetical protein MKX01_002125 [Papaver californicum]|nr:hypothetical protein MKX01_002125 [Papaver californicum]